MPGTGAALRRPAVLAFPSDDDVIHRQGTGMERRDLTHCALSLVSDPGICKILSSRIEVSTVLSTHQVEVRKVTSQRQLGQDETG